ncbi:CDP-glucose 4,6-dehydratase [Paenibacillus daejeonensis]|uniref:CDP-glucose 4,6-dehydratase n=1 Tax=Paenibacillus daejeonensis TaxID=135193 RepID=UPI00035F13E8|nr:CDP-glucose 4,6-dehydratase [Paenibacillus daejeonensis]
MNNSFWKDKKVLVTGHTGFKGAWLTLWLLSMGARVTGYANPPVTDQELFRLLQLDREMNSVIGDIRNFNRVQTVLTKTDPDIIFHLAAQPLVKYGYSHPRSTYDTNVMGTVNVLEALRNTKVKMTKPVAVVMITSDKAYDNKEWLWGYREHEQLGGFDPYSNSKACSELVIGSYRDSFFNTERLQQHGVGIASARAGNVIGGGDWAAQRLVPDCVRAYMNQETLVLRYPHAIRPWQHVLEPLNGYLLLAEKLYNDPRTYSSAWNFGPDDGDCRSVLAVVRELRKQGMRPLAYRLAREGIQQHEAHMLKLDCSKAKLQLNWQPRWPLPVALANVVSWVDAYMHQRELLSECLDQIKSHASQKVGEP